MKNNTLQIKYNSDTRLKKKLRSPNIDSSVYCDKDGNETKIL